MFKHRIIYLDGRQEDVTVLFNLEMCYIVVRSGFKLSIVNKRWVRDCVSLAKLAKQEKEKAKKK